MTTSSLPEPSASSPASPLPAAPRATRTGGAVGKRWWQGIATGYAASGPAFTPLEVLMVGAWFAILTGLGEIVVLLVLKFGLKDYVDYPVLRAIWMTPLANVMIFGAVALPLALLSSRIPGMRAPRVPLFIFCFLAAVGVLLHFHPQLHWVAIALVAGGLTFQLSGVTVAYLAGFRRLVRTTTPWLVVLVVAATIGVNGWYFAMERRALAALPPARPGAPNVLLIIWDTVRAMNLSLYGYERSTTPTLAQLGAAGVRFDRAIATAPWTLPSHVSMFTGRFLYEAHADWLTPLDDTYPTLAEVLATNGYATAGFVANTKYCGRQTGLARGFARYDDFAFAPDWVLNSSSITRFVLSSNRLRRISGQYELAGRKDAPAVNAEFLRWVDRWEGQRPYFAFLNYFDAHEPYLPPEDFVRAFATTRPRSFRERLFNDGRVFGRGRAYRRNVQAQVDSYDAAIAYLDAQLAELLGDLRRRGALENTLVILTSDHGEEFGEHGLVEHGNSLYLQALHVPLVVWFPSHLPAGSVVPEPVSIRDIPATVLDLLGVGGGVFPGRSLAGRIGAEGAAGKNDPVLSEVSRAKNVPLQYPVAKGDLQSLIVFPYHYIRNSDGREEVYDIEHDPREQHDLSVRLGDRGGLVSLRSALDSALQGVVEKR